MLFFEYFFFFVFFRRLFQRNHLQMEHYKRKRHHAVHEEKSEFFNKKKKKNGGDLKRFFNFFYFRNDQWIESLHNYNYQIPSSSERTSTDLYRQNQAAALFEERKRHYEAQQLNYLRYLDKLNGKKSRSHTNGNIVTSNAQNSTKKRREINLPEPDYSPNIHRADSFETRPPLRSALRSSRY